VLVTRHDSLERVHRLRRTSRPWARERFGECSTSP